MIAVMRWIRWLLITLAVLVAVAGAAVVALLTVDLGRFKSNFEAYVSEATGREFVIAGRFEPSIGKTVDLVVEGVRLANADWGTAEHILEIDRLVVSIDTMSLLSNPIQVLNLELDGFVLHVEKDPATRRSSWSFGDDPVPVDGADGKPFRPPVLFKQARLQGIAVTYGRGWLDEPRTVTVSDAGVSSDAEELLAVKLEGAVGDDPIAVDGLIGPFQALIDGHELQWELQATVGQFEASTNGTFRDLFTLEGPSIQAVMQGPAAERALARFGLPALAHGPVDLDVAIAEESNGVDLRVAGEFGDLTTSIQGRATSLTSFQDAALSLGIRGPDLQALGKMFGADYLPAREFLVEGAVSKTGNSLQLESVVLSAGDARVELDGMLAPAAVDPDARMNIVAYVPETGELLPPALADDIPSGTLDLRAVVSGEAGRPVLRQLDATLGDDILAVRMPDGSIDLAGMFGEQPIPHGATATIAFRGADLESILQPWADVLVPELPFEIEGNLAGSDGALLLSNVAYRLGDLRGTVQGSTGMLPSLEGLRIEYTLTSSDISQLRDLLVDPDADLYLPQTDFESHATVSKTNAGWYVDSTAIRIGDSRFEMKGALGDFESAAGIDIDFATSGPDLRVFVPDSPIEEPVSYAFSGGLKVGDTSIELQEVDLRIGRMTAWLDGRLPTSDELMNAEFDVSIQGPDLRRVGHALGVGSLPAEAFSLQGSVDRSGRAYRIEGLRAVLGDNDLSGELGLEIGEKVGITGRLESGYFDLAELTGDEDEVRAAASTDTDRVIPDLRVPLDFLDIADVDVSVRLHEFKSQYFGVGDVELAVRIDADSLHVGSTRVPLTYGGILRGSVDLVRTDGDQAELRLRADAEQFRLRPPIDNEGNTIRRPPQDLKLELSANGGTTRELAASANGTVDLRIGKGDIDNQFQGYLMRDFVAQTFAAVNPLAETSRYTTLNCGFAVLDIVDGMATSRALGFQTDELAVASLGTINLATEEVDISYRVKQREGVGISVAGVANPYIKVGGTLADPELEIDAVRGLLSGTVAVLTGGLSILAQGAWDRYLSADDYCDAVLAALDAGEIPGMQDE